MNTRDWFDDLKAVRGVVADSDTKHLLLVLFTYVRQDSCWPSVETLAEGLGLGVRATQARISQAVQAGWIRIEKRMGDGGRQTTNRYIIDLDRVHSNQAKAEQPADSGVRSTTPHPLLRGAADDTGRVQSTTPPGVQPTAPLLTTSSNNQHQQHAVVAGSSGQAKNIEAKVAYLTARPEWLPSSKNWIAKAQAHEIALLDGLTQDDIDTAFREVRRAAPELRNPAGLAIAKIQAAHAAKILRRID